MSDGVPADALKVKLELLAEASRAFAEEPLGSPELFNLIARKVCEHVADNCVLRVLSEDREWLETVALQARDPRTLTLLKAVERVWRQRVEEGASAPVVATGKALFVPVVDQAALFRSVSPQFSPILKEFTVRSLLGIPLKAHGRLLGVALLSRSENLTPFTRDDLELAQELCDRAALALENARLYREAQQMIAQLKEGSAELERRVAERTEALRRATEVAEAASQELEAFSYSVAHDLRAPLRALDGFSLALAEDCGPQLDAQGQEYLRFLREGACQMGRLIDDLLELSRVSRAQLRTEPVDLTGMVHGLLRALRRDEPERAVTVTVEEDLVARGDPRLLEVALGNLLGNAWKFTAKRQGAEIAVGRGPSGEGDRFFVRDNGAGFDMAYAAKLFGPFQRLHGAREFPGTGVGLAIVQRVLRRHGGRCWAEGAVDAGATFHLELPREAEAS